MSVEHEDIRHDGGTHRVEVEIEGDFIQRGIDARQQIKVEQMMKGTVTPAIDPFDPYNPNDPRNW